ncbi:hypothetical protein NDU88_004728 [Pleurodeles waltl]|uniref:Uncharacterized protein n=1 Tax=Pleurodeles waltl TaxID=8319 RepID=A0AAV7KZ79_PLEWA|nr:hypothetical protein NDU88_004728 [Pleurodeles waltl]
MGRTRTNRKGYQLFLRCSVKLSGSGQCHGTPGNLMRCLAYFMEKAGLLLGILVIIDAAMNSENTSYRQNSRNMLECYELKILSIKT